MSSILLVKGSRRRTSSLAQKPLPGKWHLVTVTRISDRKQLWQKSSHKNEQLTEHIFLKLSVRVSIGPQLRNVLRAAERREAKRLGVRIFSRSSTPVLYCLLSLIATIHLKI